MKKKISVIIPCLNEEENVLPMHNRLVRLAAKLKSYQFEFVFVDNGSQDHTAKIIHTLANKDKRAIGVFLSRNFGPNASTIAGLDYATGDAMVMVACDMQDPPELISDFVTWWEKGYDVVLGTYKNIHENLFMNSLRRMFYQLFHFASSIEVPINNTGFGLMSERVVEAMRSMPETYMFFRGVRAWVGFETKYITYTQAPRKRGKSSYNLFRYFRFAERSLLALSVLPLDIAMNMAMLAGIVCIPFGLVAWILRVPGIFGTFAGCVGMTVAGLLFITMSMVGKYVQVIFEETKRRPIYVVRQVVNSKKKRIAV